MSYKGSSVRIRPEDASLFGVDPVSTFPIDYSPDDIDSPFSGRYNQEKESNRGEIE